MEASNKEDKRNNNKASATIPVKEAVVKEVKHDSRQAIRTIGLKIQVQDCFKGQKLFFFFTTAHSIVMVAKTMGISSNVNKIKLQHFEKRNKNIM